jgi:flagellin-specific chaperone FliS
MYSTILLISCKCFKIPISYHRKFSISRLASENYDNDNEIEIQTIREDIKDIIKMFVNAEGGISSVSPTVLMENAHILTKGRLYEYVMEKTIEECDNKKDISKIEAIDAFMKGFIVSERYLYICM